MINHRILYPRAEIKAGWTAVGAPTGWEATKKTGILVPEVPSLSSYVESGTGSNGFFESEDVENYTLLAGEHVLSATLRAYCVATSAKGFAIFIFEESNKEETYVTSGTAAWYAATWTAALTQEQIEKLQIHAEDKEKAKEKGNVIYAWYIDLETETEAPPETGSPVTPVTVVPGQAIPVQVRPGP